MTRKPINESWQNLTGKDLSIYGIVTGFLAYGAMIVWLNLNYMSTAAGADLTAKVETNRLLIVDVAKEISISNALGTVSRLETRRDYLHDIEIRDGPSAALSVRKSTVAADLTVAVEYKNCIIKEETGCQYLKK